MFSDTKRKYLQSHVQSLSIFRELNGNFWCTKQSISLTVLSVVYMWDCACSAGVWHAMNAYGKAVFFPPSRSCRTNTYQKKGMTVITWLTNKMKISSLHWNMIIITHHHKNGGLTDLIYKCLDQWTWLQGQKRKKEIIYV